MSIVLTKEQKLIRQSAREFAKRCLKPITAELDESAAFPQEAVDLMAENDFLGIILPAAFGGTEAGYGSYLLVVEELSRVCAAAASILVNHCAAAYAINRWGSAEQKQRYLPALASGELLGGLAVNEDGPAIGKGAEPLMATRDAGGFRLQGRKMHVGNAGVAGVYVFPACLAEGDAKSLAVFAVAATTPGLSIGPAEGKMGLRGFPTADLVFSDVALEEGDILGTLKQGQVVLEETLAATAVAEGAQTIGIMQTAIEEATAYSKKRIQFGQPIANFEAVQSLLAEAITHCHLARLAIYDTARLVGESEPFLKEAAMVKWFCARTGPAGLISAIQVEGGFGYSEEAPLARLYRDIWGTTIADIPSDFPERVIVGKR